MAGANTSSSESIGKPITIKAKRKEANQLSISFYPPRASLNGPKTVEDKKKAYQKISSIPVRCKPPYKYVFQRSKTNIIHISSAHVTICIICL